MNNVWFLSRLRGKERTCQTRPNATLRVWPDAAHLAWSLVDFPLAWSVPSRPALGMLRLWRLLGYPCCIPSAKREGQGENRKNPTAPGTRQCASAQQTEADRPGSAHRTAFANAAANQAKDKTIIIVTQPFLVLFRASKENAPVTPVTPRNIERKDARWKRITPA